MGNIKQSRHFITFLFLLIIINLFGKAFVNAQSETVIPGQHPEIGIVLGGGSAGGFAHIGVLKWLEEKHIPVDYITGTSMGGLMGGCFAMGMTPDEIEKLAESIDWNSVFNPVAPYDSLDFRRKEDFRDYPLNGIGFRDHKINIPNGISIYQIDMVLSRVTLRYSLVKNFMDLPIPFKCIATDIHKGKSVVLESGSLQKALRATMSLPVVFAPVKYNGQMLVDGGILNNLPVKEVKAMGAEVVIAVNITSPSADSDDISSVVARTLDTVTANNVISSASLANILVEPSLTELGLFRWDAVGYYVKLGYQAAEKQKDILMKYSLDDSAWERYLQVRRKRYTMNPPIPHDVEVLGATAINKTAIEKYLQSYIGKPVNTDLLERDLTALMGAGLYDSLSYEFILRNDEPVLAVTVQEKSYGPPFINFSSQATFQHDNSKIDTAIRITNMNVTGPGSEVRFDVGIGAESAILLEHFQPLLNSKWFISPSLYGKYENSSLF